MTKIVALCGASASGKSMICKQFAESHIKRKYIATTTAQVRDGFDNPSYDYLCSPMGNQLMHLYQQAIADNLWQQLLEAMNEAEMFPNRYDYIVLDRSPLDAYIYEELFEKISGSSPRTLYSKAPLPDVGLKSFTRFFQAYDEKGVERHFSNHLHLVGLTSLFPSDDPKRPKPEINEKYANEVRRIFNLGKVANHDKVSLRPLPNTTLQIDGRIRLLKNLLQDDYDED